MRITLQPGVVAEFDADQAIDFIIPGDGDVTVSRERPVGTGDELAVRVSGARVTVSGGVVGARYGLTRGGLSYRIRCMPKGTQLHVQKPAAPTSPVKAEKAQPVGKRW